MVHDEPVEKPYITVGVTGHIDHGKTALVGALTGVDTDTHPEEKRRGITIDLGFAAMKTSEFTFAFIDAPGHQKYVGNLLAGVSAVDVGLLVVACDQGIQAQTLEHAAILKTLGVSKLIVALTRIDLAEQRQDEVCEEIEVFLADYGFEEMPLVRVSVVTGAGVDRLKSELGRVARSLRPRTRLRQASLRLPIDRVLQVPGRGLVVAGTIWTGQVTTGDIVQLAGSDASLRVREIEVHGEMVSSSRPGIRTAVNLAGDTDCAIGRGSELVRPGTHRLADGLLVQIELFPETHALKMPATVQLHTATTACAARLVGSKHVQPGSRTVVLVQPQTPVVATVGQACLLRRPYPIGSFAGGQVLASFQNTRRKKRELLALGEQLANHYANGGTPNQTTEQVIQTAVKLVRVWTRFAGELTLEPDWCELELGIFPAEIGAVREEAANSDEIQLMGDCLVARSHLESVKRRVLKILEIQAQANEDDWSITDSLVERVRSSASSLVIKCALNQLIKSKAIVEFDGRLALASERTLLSKKQRASMEQVLRCYEGSRTPPATKDIAGTLGLTRQAVDSLVRHASQQGRLLDLGQGLFIDRQVFEHLRKELLTMFAQQPELTVAMIRDGWGVTRKHAVPLLEYCDRVRLTERRDDVRIAGPALDALENGEAG